MSDTLTLASFYRGWDAFQGLLVKTIAPLSDEQLAVRASPSLRPAWQLAGHIYGTRASWFNRVLGEGDAAFAALDRRTEPGDPPKPAHELVAGLNLTWATLNDCLQRWTPSMLEDVFTPERNGRSFRLTRQWVIWHVLEHDLFHGGELLLTLGMHGIAVPDL